MKSFSAFLRMNKARKLSKTKRKFFNVFVCEIGLIDINENKNIKQTK